MAGHPQRGGSFTVVSAKASILIARPAEPVFTFVAVDFFKNYQRWSPEVQRLELLSPGPVRVGSSARQVRVDQGRRTETSFRVSVFDPPRRVEFVETANRFHIHYHLDPVGGQTRLTFAFALTRVELFMRPFEKLIRVAVQDGAAQVVRNIKGLVEREVPDQNSSC